MTAETNQIKHCFEEAPMLSSHRLVLREIEPNDLPSIMEISVYDGAYATSEAEASHVLEKIKADCATGEAVHWGICLKETDEVVGTCGYYRGYPGNVGEIGYVLRPAYRGRGIMTEAVKLVVDFGLGTMKLSTIVAYTSPANLASIGVLTRAGFHEVRSERDDLKFVKHRP
jgi:[ribosomal protein S5]-alanine N-acetyltransferase